MDQGGAADDNDDPSSPDNSSGGASGHKDSTSIPLEKSQEEANDYDQLSEDPEHDTNEEHWGEFEGCCNYTVRKPRADASAPISIRRSYPVRRPKAESRKPKEDRAQ